LDIDNRLSARELGLKAGILTSQGGEFLSEGVGDGFWPTLLRGESLQLATGAETAPLGELGGVQAFASK